MPISEYLRLAQRYRENMKLLEAKRGLKEIHKYPEDYIQCLEHKIAYHTYKGLYWDAYAGSPKGNHRRALQIRDSHYRKREGILEELHRYRTIYSFPN